MKITAVIVDANFGLIGFKVSGKSHEFGYFGNEPKEFSVSINWMMESRFNNSQLYAGNGKLTEKGGFHINQLPMLMSANGQMNPVNNTIKLTSRYVNNNENIGFGVEFGDGNTAKYKYADIIKLSSLFRPENFVIKTNDKGRVFIAGKSGCAISDLPVVAVGDAGTAKKTKSGAVEGSAITGGGIVNNTDIIDLFEFVNKHNGFIINFHDTKYEATGETTKYAADNFKSLGIGEVASPYLQFAETAFNASCRFKNPGFVSMPTENTGAPTFIGMAQAGVYSYIFRTKNIFYNGDIRLKRLGVILQASDEAEFISVFGKSMSITPVTDETTIKVVNQLINWSNSKIYEVDVSKLALISPAKYDGFILNHADLFNAVLKMSSAKMIKTYARGAIKGLNAIGVFNPPKNREIAPQFRMKSQDELEKLILAGVDIYTGAFTEDGRVEKNSSAEDKSANPEVRYIIDGLDPKNYDYKKLCDPDKCPDIVAGVIRQLDSIEDPVERIKKLNSAIDEYDKLEYEAKKKLWLHKTAMWLKSGKRGVCMDDSRSWVVNTKKRTKAICYDCLDAAAPGLQILCLNTNIVV